MRHSRRALLSAGIGLAGATLLRPLESRAAELRFADDPFTLGVASGYPEPDGVVLWTRLAPEPLVPGGGMPAAPVEVAWELATRRADAQRRPPRPRSRGRRNGRTPCTSKRRASRPVATIGTASRAAGSKALSAARARLPAPRHDAGTLHARRRVMPALRAKLLRGLSRRSPPTCPISSSTSATTSTRTAAPSRMRTHDQPECYTLDDYRLRYSLYKSDPNLQAAHAAAPWLLVSDDHEVANDYAGEHSFQGDPREVFLARRAAAYQAWYEHQPLPRRFMPLAGRQRLYTSRSFGDLVDDLDARRPAISLAASVRTRTARRRPAPSSTPASARCSATAQERWLAAALGASTRALDAARPADGVHALRPERRRPARPTGPTRWNGYPAARARLVETPGAAQDAAIR